MDPPVVKITFVCS